MAWGNTASLLIVLALGTTAARRRRDLRDIQTLIPSSTAPIGHDKAKVAGAHATVSYCPLSEDLSKPTPLEYSHRCPEFSSSACCSEKEHEKLDKDFITAYDAIYSECSGCLENMRKLLCTIHCSPKQHELVQFYDGHQTPLVKPKGVVAIASSAAVSQANEEDQVPDGNTLPIRAETTTPARRVAFAPLCYGSCKRWYRSCSQTRPGNLFQGSGKRSFCEAQMNSVKRVFLQIVNDTNPGHRNCINLAGPDICTAAGLPVFMTSKSFWRSHVTVIVFWTVAMVIIFSGLMLCTLTLGGVFGGKPVSKSSSAVTPVSSPSEADQVKARVLLALKAKKSKGSNAQIERKQKQDAGEHTTRQNGPVLGSDTETKHAETNKAAEPGAMTADVDSTQKDS